MARAVGDRLRDIREALLDLEMLGAGLSRANFMACAGQDRKTYLAIQAAFTLLGATVKALPDEITARHPSIEWRGIAGMRDVLVHHYYRVDADILWETLSGPDLKMLKTVIAAELKNGRIDI